MLIGTLAGVGLLLSSFGGSATPPDMAVAKADAFEIGYLPSYAKGLAAFRPALLMAQPGMDDAKAKIAEGVQWLREKGFTVPDTLQPENIEQIVVDAGITSKGTGEPGSRSLIFGSTSMYIRLKQDFDWPAFFKNLAKEVAAATNAKWSFEVKENREEGVTIYDLGVLSCSVQGPFFFPCRIAARWCFARCRETHADRDRCPTQNTCGSSSKMWLKRVNAPGEAST